MPKTYGTLEGGREVLVTFDDGPHPTLTPRLLDCLRDADVKGIFFVLGNRVAATGGDARVCEWMVVRESVLTLAVGVPIGLLAALFTTRLAAPMLYGFTPTDPVHHCSGHRVADPGRSRGGVCAGAPRHASGPHDCPPSRVTRSGAALQHYGAATQRRC